jgi:RimJ/RimL family protein N-acetyltransferase
MQIQTLSPHEYPILAQTLGDSPATVIPLHQLREGFAQATLVGSATDLEAVVIQANDEPTGFGRNAEALWAILQTLSNWFCVEAETSLGHELAALATNEGRACRLYTGIYYNTLTGPPHPQPQPHLETRLLTLDDMPIWQRAPGELQASGFKTPQELLARGCAAGSFANGELVALAQTYALSDRYADIGVHTAEAYRGRGLAACAAQLVMQQVQADGRISLWSTGEDNYASQRVAEKLGLRETLRRVYVIFE